MTNGRNIACAALLFYISLSLLFENIHKHTTNTLAHTDTALVLGQLKRIYVYTIITTLHTLSIRLEHLDLCVCVCVWCCRFVLKKNNNRQFLLFSSTAARIKIQRRRSRCIHEYVTQICRVLGGMGDKPLTRREQKTQTHRKRHYKKIKKGGGAITVAWFAFPLEGKVKKKGTSFSIEKRVKLTWQGR